MATAHILRSRGASDYFRFSMWDGEGVDHDPLFSRGYDFDLLDSFHSEPCDCAIGPGHRPVMPCGRVAEGRRLRSGRRQVLSLAGIQGRQLRHEIDAGAVRFDAPRHSHPVRRRRDRRVRAMRVSGQYPSGRGKRQLPRRSQTRWLRPCLSSANPFPRRNQRTPTAPRLRGLGQLRGPQ